MDKIREEFESYWTARCNELGIECVLTKLINDEYYNIAAHYAWLGWQAAKAQAVPEGYRLMPPEPTPEMIKAWRESPFSDDHEENLTSGYDAMFFAAPEQNK